MIEIANLSKTYHSKTGEVVSLKNVNLDIENGDVYGIIGLSGAGKSTLVRCINLLEKPTTGTILIDGEDVMKANKKRLAEIRRKVAMIFQSFNLLQQRTAIENVELAGKIAGEENSRGKATRLLESVGLGNKANAYPSELSGGEQQRVAIARALMMGPKVLLCDEATSALDPETTKSILGLIKELNDKLGLTVVVISHQMSVIEAVCNKVAVIDKSEVIEKGSLSDVFLHPKTDISKKIIYSGKIPFTEKDEKLVKIAFDGFVEKPIITNIIRECNVSLSIFYAETKELGGKTYGQVIFRLPDYDEDIGKLREYLERKEIDYEEVNGYDFR